MAENVVIEVGSPDCASAKVCAPEESIDALFKDVVDFASGIKADVAKLQQKVKSLERHIKQERKKTKSLEPKQPRKKPSGFAIPVAVTNELCEFMKESHGSKVARTDVTKYMVKYVKDNKLEDPENRRVILPDETLGRILSAKPEDEITYFNLQRFVNHHFSDKKA